MKRTNLITLLTCILIAVVAVVAIRYPRTVPYEQCSEVYKRYSSVEGVRATYVKDYRLNDTLTVAVTLLEATDSAGWEYLIKKFNISQEMIEETAIDVWTRQSLKDQPETKYRGAVADSQGDQSAPVIELVAISMKNQEICVFHTRDRKEYHAVFDNRIEANL